MDLSFHLETQAPFANDSIFVAGQFRPDLGDPIPFTLRSRFLDEMQVLIANGGITVGSNVTVQIALTFDLVAMFGNLDLANAVVENGGILIDETHNAGLLAAFEDNLRSSVEVEENKG